MVLHYASDSPLESNRDENSEHSLPNVVVTSDTVIHILELDLPGQVEVEGQESSE